MREISDEAKAFFKTHHIDRYDTVVDFSEVADGNHITDEQLKYLRYLPNIETLHLDGNRKITDKGLESISQLSQLRSLSLDNTSITDRGMESIAGLQQLTHLSLASTKISDQGIKRLSRLGFEELILYDTFVSHDVMRYLGGIGQLKQLSLGNTRINDDTLQYIIAKCPKLEHLAIENTVVTDEAVKGLMRLKHLHGAWLPKDRISSETRTAIRNYTKRNQHPESPTLPADVNVDISDITTNQWDVLERD